MLLNSNEYKYLVKLLSSCKLKPIAICKRLRQMHIMILFLKPKISLHRSEPCNRNQRNLHDGLLCLVHSKNVSKPSSSFWRSQEELCSQLAKYTTSFKTENIAAEITKQTVRVRFNLVQCTRPSSWIEQLSYLVQLRPVSQTMPSFVV